MSSGNILKYFIRWNYHLERHLSVFLDSCNWKFFNGNYSIKWRKKIVFEANQILANWNPSSRRVGIQQRPSPIIAQGTPFTPCIAIYPLVEVYVGLGGCTLYMYGTPCIVCRSRWKCTIYGTNCWHSRPTEWIQCIENEPGPKGRVVLTVRSSLLQCNVCTIQWQCAQCSEHHILCTDVHVHQCTAESNLLCNTLCSVQGFWSLYSVQ